MATWDVLGLGNSCVDYLITVDRFPYPGESLPAVNSQVQPGGQVATAMVACARLGLRVAYALRIGADTAGERQRMALAAEGIDLRLARVLDGVPSALAYILVHAQTGERGVIWNTDSRLRVEAAEISEDVIRSARLLYVDGKDEDACINAAAMARNFGIPVVCDIDFERPRTRQLVALIDHFISNDDFVAAFGGSSDLHTAIRNIAVIGPSTVCATLGPKGCLAFDGSQFISSPAFRVEVRDTTGAGDAFHAGYVHALLRGKSLRERLAFANATAGLACTAVGAQAGMPRLKEVDQLLASAEVLVHTC